MLLLVMWLLMVGVCLASQVTGTPSRAEEKFCRKPLLYSDGPTYPVGYPSKSKYTRGNLMYFRCLDGFELIGNRIRVCDEKGIWSGTAPWCNRTSCPKTRIYHPEHGSYKGDSFRIGSKVVYQCDPGYYLVGKKTLQCQSDGTWSAKNPYCVSECRRTQCKEGMKCILDSNTASPVCICKDVYDCPFRFSPVCGSDGKTYTNKCLLGMVACRAGKKIEPVKNESCPTGSEFGAQDCTPCPKIRICKALYTSGYSFLGKPEKVEDEKSNYVVTFKIIENYKGNGQNGSKVKVLLKKRTNVCSCVPRLPNTKVLVMGQYRRGKDGTPVAVIDENTFLEKFYSHKQLNLCWLYK